MPNRSSSFLIAPLPFPDFQSDINKQLSFLNTLQVMQRRAAGGTGGSVARNANGLTPYQQAQMDYKLQKDAAKAAEAEAKKNVVVGIHPVTGQPMIYRNESGQSMTEKDRERIRQSMLQDELSKAVRSDEELNRINGELYGTTPISAHRREELNKQARARTKALGAQFGVDDKTAFDAVYGRSVEMLNEQRTALKNDSFWNTAWAGTKMGFNAFLDAIKAPLVSDAQSLENARKTREENEAIRAASPTLNERMLREQENQRLGRTEGYTDVAGTNLPANIAASTAEVLTSFAPAIGVGIIPGIGTGASVAAMGYLGAGMNMAGQAARAEADPNLTEEQKRQAVSYSDPGFVGTAVAGGLTGALIPGGVTGGLIRGAGRAAAPGLAAVSKGIAKGTVRPPSTQAISTMLSEEGLGAARSRIAQAGLNSAARAAAPRSLGTLGRDIIANSAENAGLMAGNTVAANMAYNVSTGQPLMQNVTEGVKEAAAEGALLGGPFGALHTMRRNPAAKPAAQVKGAVTPDAPVTSASDSVTDAFSGADNRTRISRRDDPYYQDIEKHYTEATPDEALAIVNRSVRGALRPAESPDLLTKDDIKTLNSSKDFSQWVGRLRKAAQSGDDVTVDMLLADYVESGGRLSDLEYLLLSKSQSDSVAGDALSTILPFEPSKGSDRLLPKVKLDEDAIRTIAASIENYRRMPEQERNAYVQSIIPANAKRGGLAPVLGKLERNRTAGIAEGDSSQDSPAPAATPPASGDSSDRNIVPAGNRIRGAQEERADGTPDIRQSEAPISPESPVKAGDDTTVQPDSGADTPSPRAGSQQAGESPREPADTGLGADGEGINGKKPSGSEQPAGQPIAGALNTEGNPWIYTVELDGTAHDLSFYTDDGSFVYGVNDRLASQIPNEAVQKLFTAQVDEAVRNNRIPAELAAVAKRNIADAKSYDFEPVNTAQEASSQGTAQPVKPAAPAEVSVDVAPRDMVAEDNRYATVRGNGDVEFRFDLEDADGNVIEKRRVIFSADGKRLWQETDGKIVPLSVPKNAASQRLHLIELEQEASGEYGRLSNLTDVELEQLHQLYKTLEDTLPDTVSQKKKLGKATKQAGQPGRPAQVKPKGSAKQEVQNRLQAEPSADGEAVFWRPTESSRVYKGKATGSMARPLDIYSDGTFMTPIAEQRLSAHPTQFYTCTLDDAGNVVVFVLDDAQGTITPVTENNRGMAATALMSAIEDNKKKASRIFKEANAEHVSEVLENRTFDTIDEATQWKWQSDRPQAQKSLFAGQNESNEALESVARQSKTIADALAKDEWTDNIADTTARQIAKNFRNIRIGRDESAVSTERRDPSIYGYGEYRSADKSMWANPAAPTPTHFVQAVQGEVTHALSDEYLPSLNLHNGIFLDLYDVARAEQPEFVLEYQQYYNMPERLSYEQRAFLGEEAFAHLRAQYLNLIEPPRSSWTEDIVNTASLLRGNREAFDGLGYMLSRTARMDAATAKEYIPNVVTQAILNDAELSKSFLGSSWSSFPEGTSALVRWLANDYKDVTMLNGISRDKGTLETYLRAVLDPDTAIDVFNHGSKIC